MKKSLAFESHFPPLLLLAAISCIIVTQEPPPRGGYFGQDAPGGVLKPFYPEIFSTRGAYGYHLHSSPFFAADEDLVFFTNQRSPSRPAMTSKSL